MTKADLAALVAEKGLTKKQAMEAVEATFEALKDAMSKGEKIQLVGFGSFQ
ncbi:MAG: HU family DNA-binding protein, partial [candidate division NC10 bacterium]